MSYKWAWSVSNWWRFNFYRHTTFIRWVHSLNKSSSFPPEKSFCNSVLILCSACLVCILPYPEWTNNTGINNSGTVSTLSSTIYHNPTPQIPFPMVFFLLIFNWSLLIIVSIVVMLVVVVMVIIIVIVLVIIDTFSFSQCWTAFDNDNNTEDATSIIMTTVMFKGDGTSDK